MRKLFDARWFTITVSILAAIIIWIYVVYEINPTFETTIKNVPIKFIRHSEELTNGKLSVLSESTDTVDVKIKGKRTTLAKVNKDSVYCSVNMADVNVAGTHKIPISVSFDFSGVELVSKDPYNVSVKVDKVVTEEFNVSVETKGTPAEGFVYDTIEYSTDKIRVSGPKSIIGKIKNAIITVDIGGKTETQSGRYKIALLDSDGNRIDDSSINKNISYVELKCNILRIKEIPVSVTLSDKTTVGGKKVTIKSVSPEKVTVLGNKTAVEELTKLKTEEIRVSYVKDGSKFKVKLESVEDGVRLEDEELETVEVTLGVE